MAFNDKLLLVLLLAVKLITYHFPPVHQMISFLHWQCDFV